jgi:RHS repeat-associated protein
VSEAISGGGAFGYYDFDAVGSVVGITGANHSYSDTYAYTPFGGRLLSQGSFNNPFTFVGQAGVTAELNGLSFMRARFYLDDTGRFMTVDPLGLLGGDINTNRYSDNNPVTFTDPLGLNIVEFFHALYARNDALGTIGKGDPKVDQANVAGQADDQSRKASEAAPGAAKDILDLRKAVYGGLGTKLKFLWHIAKKWFGGRGQGLVDARHSENGPRFDPSIFKHWSFKSATTNFPSGKSGAQTSTNASGAFDPNELIGPAGFGTANYVAAEQTLSYKVKFENYGPGSVEHDGTPAPSNRWATAPAQQVEVVDDLSPLFDWTTFRFTGFGFGDKVVTPPAPATSYSTVVAMAYNGTTFDVYLDALFDLATGRVRVLLQSIDPQTLLTPDVLIGFLPPEDATGRGQGYFNFIVATKPVASGTAIRNIAPISFDDQPQIATNQVDPLDPSQGTDPT